MPGRVSPVEGEGAGTVVQTLHAVESVLVELDAPERVTHAIRSLHDQFMTREARHFELHRQIAALEDEQQRLTQALGEARKRGADLASLYVATHRLHSTLDRGAVIQALEEIVASLLGCEELAVFELIGSRTVLAPVASVGIPAGRLGIVEVGVGTIGRSVALGETWLAPDAEPQLDQITACVPLKVDGDVTGALVLFRLLDHKGSLEAPDLELLEVLATHAGTALLATRLRAQQGAKQ